jgi:hypothetical protein
MIVVMTIAAAAAFVCSLLRWAVQRRQRLATTHSGTHRRSSDQPPNAMLLHAIATVGTHGLGLTRKRADR